MLAMKREVVRNGGKWKKNLDKGEGREIIEKS